MAQKMKASEHLTMMKAHDTQMAAMLKKMKARPGQMKPMK